jgi:hypothetical protein
MSTRERDGRLYIAHGAGAPIEVDAKIAREQKGKTIEVLRNIVKSHFPDEKLSETLGDPRLAIDMFIDDEDNPEETPISPWEDWQSSVVSRLEQGAVELGVARSHTGG